MSGENKYEWLETIVGLIERNLLTKKIWTWIVIWSVISSSFIAGFKDKVLVGNKMEVTANLVFIIGLVAFIMIMSELWVAKMRRVLVKKDEERKMTEIVERLKLSELGFLMSLCSDGSTRGVISCENQNFINLKGIGVVSKVNAVSDGKIHIEINSGYLKRLVRVEERFREGVLNIVKLLELRDLEYIKSFIRNEWNDKTQEYYDISRKINMFSEEKMFSAEIKKEYMWLPLVLEEIMDKVVKTEEIEEQTIKNGEYKTRTEGWNEKIKKQMDKVVK